MARGRTILIVEDEPALRRFLELLLRRHGFEVRAAEDGQAALDCLAEATPDLVLLDLMLPKIDGFEVCRRLRAQPATAATPVFVVTARATQEARRRCAVAGADAFIAKPYDPRALVEQITRRLEGGAAGSGAPREAP
ncbi:MAG: response regulator [Candidatus Eisenbacteria bacterium]|nr:response regulator [Candidatus Eisenbacteria bacterium]